MTTALITGASSGIGLELAKIMATKKHDLVLVARREEALNELKNTLEKEQGVKVTVIAKDLSKPETAQSLYDEVKAQGIQVDYLVNNAGFGDYGEFTETDWAKEHMMIDLNITTLTWLSKLFVKDMVARKQGHIMNVASTAAFQPGPLMAVYYATKSYVLHFSEALASEVAPAGVKVTALCPGATLSGFQDAAAQGDSALVKGKKLPTSQEVAAYGYDAMLKGKTVAIHGMMNWLMAFSIRFTPRKLVPLIVGFIQRKA